MRYWRDTAPGPDPGGPAEPPPPKLLSNFSWPCRYICRKRKLRVGVGIWDLLTGGVRTVTVCLVCIVCAVCIVRTVIAVPILFQHFLKSHRSNPQRKHDECGGVAQDKLLHVTLLGHGLAGWFCEWGQGTSQPVLFGYCFTN